MATAAKTKPILHIEVRLKSSRGVFVRTDLVRREVADWLSTEFLNLSIDQDVNGYDDLEHAHVIDSINVVDASGTAVDTAVYKLDQVQLDVQAYELHSDDGSPSRRVIEQWPEQEMDQPQARVTLLPSRALSGAWDSLVYEDKIPARLLQFMTRMILLMKRPGLNLSIFNWNRLILLHGFPGTGKTTLCRALAQRLTIRLGRHYTSGKLVEINSHALLSKWFSESGKLVGKMFEDIQTMANEETTFICVLIDEVESIAGSREKSVRGSDCSDGLRATNQLLTALDRLRDRHNIMVMCTSNMLTAIDPAFLDRVDVKQHIPNPGPTAIYEIFRSCLNELIRTQLITSIPDSTAVTDFGGGSSGTGDYSSSPGSPFASSYGADSWELLDAVSIPSYAEMNVHLFNQPLAPARRLWQIAQKCDGLSGRTLRRLPFLALAMHTFGDVCSLHEALSALAAAVEQEAYSMRVRDVGASMV
ncbi:hypothetical protein LTR50_005364 [Elasticomyces elasticus]|nr:hypothetical protein LTR50_005364 [Elasticomyces elasticus]